MKEFVNLLFSIAILFAGCMIAAHHGVWIGFGCALGASMVIGVYAAVHAAHSAK